MKNIVILIISTIMLSPTLHAQTKAGKTNTAKNVSLYSCPKHSEVISHKAGSCRICGMKLSLSPKEQMKADVTKLYNCPVHLNVTSHDPGKCPQCGTKMGLAPKEQMKAEVTRINTCPMHPQTALDKNGNCPKCKKH